MSEEKKETWLGYVATSTILFAVCATLSTFKGGQHSTRAVLSQSKATNQWAYYQSKDLKSYLHELHKDALDLAVLGADKGGAAKGGGDYAQAVRKKAQAYADKIAKYDVQKEEIKQQATAYDNAIALAQAHSNAFGMAVIFLQIAILLSSVSALMKMKPVWYGGLAVGAVGVAFFANGFFLFF